MCHYGCPAIRPGVCGEAAASDEQSSVKEDGYFDDDDSDLEDDENEKIAIAEIACPRRPAPPLPRQTTPVPANTPSLGTSDKLREEGNALLSIAMQVGLAPVLYADRLSKVIAKYRSCVTAAGARFEELAALASGSKNLGVAINKFIHAKSLKELGGARSLSSLTAEALHALAVASSAGERVGRTLTWLQGIAQVARDLVAHTSATLSADAADLDAVARQAQALAEKVCGEVAGGGAAMASNTFGYYWTTCLASAFAGTSAPFFAPLCARLHLGAARALFNAVVARTEEAGAISKSEAEAARERMRERREARTAAHEAAVRLNPEASTDDEDGEDAADAADGVAPARSLEATRAAEVRALQMGLPCLAEAASHLKLAGGRYLEATNADGGGGSERLAATLRIDVAELSACLDTQSSVLTSRQYRLLGEATLRTALEGAEDLNMTGVQLALDAFLVAAREAEGVDLEAEAMVSVLRNCENFCERTLYAPPPHPPPPFLSPLSLG